MIRRLFIANRGEIAVRVLRTAQRLGITTIAGVSAADRHSLVAKLADEVALIGPAPSSESYLNVGAVTAAAVACPAAGWTSVTWGGSASKASGVSTRPLAANPIATSSTAS